MIKTSVSISDPVIHITGTVNTFRLLFEQEYPGGIREMVHALDTGHGCLVRTTSIRSEGSESIATAIVFVPGVRVERQPDGRGTLRSVHVSEAS